MVVGVRAVSDAEFREVLLKAVDYGLLVFGENVRKTIYDRVESYYQMKRGEIPEKLDSFHGALVGLFGRGGSVVERLIAKKLYLTLQLRFEAHENWTLVDYVNHAKKAVRVG